MSVYISLTITFFVICSVVFFLRILNPHLHRHWKTLCEQLLISIAYVFIVVLFVVSVEVYDRVVDMDRHRTDMAVESAANALYLYDVVNQTQTVMTMLSIAVTYQIFLKMSTSRWYHRAIRGLLLFQCLYVTTIVPIAIPCRPNGIWTLQLDSEGHCTDLGVIKVIMCSICLLNDLAFAVLPIPILKGLTTHRAKLAVTLLVCIGIIVIAADCLTVVLSIRYWLIPSTTNFGMVPSAMRTADIFFRGYFRTYILFAVACVPQARSTVAYWLRGRSTSLRKPQQHRTSVDDQDSRLENNFIGMLEKTSYRPRAEGLKSLGTLLNCDGFALPFSKCRLRDSDVSGLDTFGSSESSEGIFVDDARAWNEKGVDTIYTLPVSWNIREAYGIPDKMSRVITRNRWTEISSSADSITEHAHEHTLAQTIYTLPFLKTVLSHTKSGPQESKSGPRNDSSGDARRRPSNTLPSPEFDYSTMEGESDAASESDDIFP